MVSFCVLQHSRLLWPLPALHFVHIRGKQTSCPSNIKNRQNGKKCTNTFTRPKTAALTLMLLDSSHKPHNKCEHQKKKIYIRTADYGCACSIHSTERHTEDQYRNKWNRTCSHTVRLMNVVIRIRRILALSICVHLCVCVCVCCI